MGVQLAGYSVVTPMQVLARDGWTLDSSVPRRGHTYFRVNGLGSRIAAPH